MFQHRSIMKVYVMAVVLGLAATSLSVAIPKPGEADDQKNRVVDRELSDQKHYDDLEHNPEYDHEAFLGREEARRFEDLSPEQSKDKLGIIYDKIDNDKDGGVTQDELQNWIKYVQNKYIHEDTERQWKEHTVDEGKLAWDSYKSRTYGNIDETGDEDEYNYKDMIRRDKRRWEKADSDGDDKLTQEEFALFLHPEESESMRDIVVEETLEDIDKDKDGVISLEEYIGDMYPGADEDEEEEQPDWVHTERDQFMTVRDKDGDGFLDHKEIAEWIIPDDYDHVHAESEHLFNEADVDKDGVLTKEEVVEKYDLFVGSQATDFGEALSRHDEF